MDVQVYYFYINYSRATSKLDFGITQFIDALAPLGF